MARLATDRLHQRHANSARLHPAPLAHSARPDGMKAYATVPWDYGSF